MGTTRKIINLRTALFISISFAIGVYCYYCLVMSEVVKCIIASISFITLLSFSLYRFIKNKSNKKGVVVTIAFLSSFILGFSLLGISVSNFSNADLGNHICDITAKVCEVKPNENGYKLLLNSVEIGYPEYKKTDYKICAYLTGESDLDIGDVITFTETLIDRDVIYDGKFACYDLSDKIKYTVFLEADSYTRIGNEKNIFEKSNLFIRDTLLSGLDEEQFTVAYALLTGNSQFMENDLITNFRASGIAHIFAVSGLHVGILSAVLTFVFAKFKINKIIRAILIVLALTFYSGVCGFTSSSLRATIMCAVALISSGLGERYDGLSSTGVALLIILLMNPAQLFTAGFQLSFGVIFGLFLLARPISKLFKFLPKNIANSIGAVIASQLASIPIMIAHFSSFSAISVLINLLFLPLTFFIFVFSLISTLLAGILNFSALLVPLNLLFKLIIIVMEYVDFTVFTVGALTVSSSVIFYYSSLIVVSGIINIKRKLKMLLCIALSVCFALVFSIENIKGFNSFKVSVIGDNQEQLSLIEKGNDSALIVRATGDWFTSSPLRKISNGLSEKVVDKVVLIGDSSETDKQALITWILEGVDFKEFYYFGDIDVDFYVVMKKSFPKIKCYAVKQGTIDLGDMYGEYYTSDCFLVGRENEKAIFIADTKVVENLRSMNLGKIDLGVCVDRADYVYSVLDVEEKITHEYSEQIKSTARNGIIRVKM